MDGIMGIVALGVTTLLGLVITFIWKKITGSASQADMEKLERSCADSRKEMWLEINNVKIEQAKSEAFREAISKQLEAMDHKIDKIYDVLERKQNKEVRSKDNYGRELFSG